PRGLVTTFANEPAPEASLLRNIRVAYRLAGVEVDSFAAPDFTIPAVAVTALFSYHLAGSGTLPFVHRTLTTAAPGAGLPRVDPIYLDSAGSAAFRSPVLTAPVTLQNSSASLWMVFTSTTPALAVNFFNARVHRIDADGTRTLIGQREQFVTGANPNIFTTPGVPQRVLWNIVFTEPAVPAGAALELEIAATGILDLGDNGPGFLLYGSAQFDSMFFLQGTAGPTPLIPVTDPPLGTLVYSLRGSAGTLTTTRPTEATPDAVVAAGGADVSPAVWTSTPLPDSLTLTGAAAEIIVSSSTASPVLALNFLDAQVFADTTGGSVLVARRTEYLTGANPNSFVAPGVPLRMQWPLSLLSPTIPSGATIRLVVTAEALTDTGPTEATVWSDAVAADSVLRLKTAAVSVVADPPSAAAGDTISLSGSIPGGLPPFTYEWRFGDGNGTSPAATSSRTVGTSHAYAAAGLYPATLIVTDSTGSTGGASAAVSVVDPSSPTVISGIATNVFLPTLGTARVTWTTDRAANGTVYYGLDPGDVVNTSASHAGTGLSHEVNLSGLAAGTKYYFRVVSNNVTSGVSNFTTAGDFTGDAVVVVAVIDTGINPYHTAFRRTGRTAHPATYITGYPADTTPLVLDLAAGDYATAVANDAALWTAVEGDRLYWVPGTNLVGVIDKGDASALNSAADVRRILDDDGHGTWTSGTVERANDDVLLVAVEAIGGAGITWAAAQPWIDVISMSFGGPAVPLVGVSAAIEAAASSGKLIVAAAGNTPNPQIMTTPTGYPQSISVGGAQPSVFGEEAEASKGPDVLSDYTIGGLPDHASLSATESASGTSFATPNVAGTLSRVLFLLRDQYGDTTEGTPGGLVAAPSGTGAFLGDGSLSALEMREAMNRTAEWWDTTDWAASVSVPIAPGAPWVQMGWGYMGPSLVNALYATTNGSASPTKPDEARAYMDAHYAARTAYYMDVQEEADVVDRDTFLTAVDLPGPGVNVVAIPTVETPHPYLPDTDVEYTITEPGASAVSVHFEDFSTETGFDLVTVADGAGNVVATYSLEGGASFWTPYVPGDTVVIHFTSDGGVQRNGFVVDEIDVLT
ncbi:MAG: S8 family serine peptidase, partial [Methanobacteriota archaeon]